MMTASATPSIVVSRPDIAEVPRKSSRGFTSRLARGVLRNPGGLLGLVLLLVMCGAALAAPLMAPQDPLRQSLVRRLQAPGTLAGSITYLLGTDQLGRDTFSRILFGAQVSLSISLTVVVLATIIGVGIGLLAGLRRGWVELIAMRVADSLLALPFMVVAIAIIAVWGAGRTQLVVLLTAFVWVPFARLVRAEVLSAREKEYVEAARCIGAGGFRVALIHILPNVLSPVIVLSTFSVASMIVAESALSFLGLGVPPPAPTWGSMLAEGRGYLDTAWWLSVFPGLAITLTVMGVNFLGDALRDVLDPRQRL
jgi:peptide/nickel transport system permease protein